MTQETTHRKPSGLRARLQATRNDERGIALQTVIIMVVLLAIAGTVAAVLFNRADTVTSELQDTDVTPTLIDSAAECEGRKPGSAAATFTAPSTCVWKGTDVTTSRCGLARGATGPGALTGTSGQASATCTID